MERTTGPVAATARFLFDKQDVSHGDVDSSERGAVGRQDGGTRWCLPLFTFLEEKDLNCKACLQKHELFNLIFSDGAYLLCSQHLRPIVASLCQSSSLPLFFFRNAASFSSFKQDYFERTLDTWSFCGIGLFSAPWKIPATLHNNSNACMLKSSN